MRSTSSHLSSKSQVTMPSWVKKSLGVKANVSIIWMELNPGEVSIFAKDNSKKSTAEKLCGIMKAKAGNRLDAVESFLRDKKEDLMLEERGFLTK
jgi:fatty acid-binding protein DegV